MVVGIRAGQMNTRSKSRIPRNQFQHAQEQYRCRQLHLLCLQDVGDKTLQQNPAPYGSSRSGCFRSSKAH